MKSRLKTRRRAIASNCVTTAAGIHVTAHRSQWWARAKLRRLTSEQTRREKGKSTDKAIGGQKAPTAGGKKHRQGSGKKHLLIISPGRCVCGVVVRYRPCSSALIVQTLNGRTQASTTPAVRQTRCATGWQANASPI
jgi:hypothetical protein